MSDANDDRLRARAHQLWEQAGRPEGRDKEFWLKAELDLKEEKATNPDEKSTTFLK